MNEASDSAGAEPMVDDDDDDCVSVMMMSVRACVCVCRYKHVVSSSS